MKMLPDSSVTMWEKAAKRIKTPSGWKATIPGEYMPDGEPFVAVLQGHKVTAGMVEQFYTAVKGAYDARENRKEAEASRRAELAADGAGRANRNERSAAHAPASQTPAPETQEGVEEYLQSQIVRLTQRAADLILESTALRDRADLLELDEIEARAKLRKLEAALAALKGE